MHSRRLLILAFLIAFPPSARAQAPAEPPKPLTVSASVGLALTAGNKDTSTFNFGYELVHDPKTRNVVKSDGLFIRGTTDGELNAERLGLNGRDEYRLRDRIFTFGQLQYLRDKFKAIDYLVAPSGGLGYKVSDTPQTQFTVDGGLGGVWEKNPDQDVQASGAVTFGEKLVHKLSTTTTLTQSVASLWKTSDFGDSLLTFGIGVAASMTTRTQLKVDLLDTYKNKPPSAATQKNDVALLVAIVYKN